MTYEEKIAKAQHFLKQEGLDGWLLYDFARNNPLCYSFLEFPENKIFRRRFFYWIPKEGAPIKIVHAIEAHVLDRWPGSKEVYFSWQSLHALIQKLLKGKKRVAMEYSPRNEIPYVSKVDGGTLDWIRSLGVQVESSAPFLPYFTAVLDPLQAKSHIQAGFCLDLIVKEVWQWIFYRLKKGDFFTEFDVQQKILEEMGKKQLITDTPPNVSVNAHSADPHYSPNQTTALPINLGDFILIDLWAKEKSDRSIYADITRVGVAADHPTERQEEIFQIVRKAQREATDLVIQRFSEKKKVLGYEVDDVARSVIIKHGYGDFFIHRTGHNIGEELHGSGAHLDNLETHDARPILPGSCFSIEPGIYLPDDFGIRLEYDVYVDLFGNVQIVGGVQEKIVSFV